MHEQNASQAEMTTDEYNEGLLIEARTALETMTPDRMRQVIALSTELRIALDQAADLLPDEMVNELNDLYRLHPRYADAFPRDYERAKEDCCESDVQIARNTWGEPRGAVDATR